jgi:hypothetical protein
LFQVVADAPRYGFTSGREKLRVYDPSGVEFDQLRVAALRLSPDPKIVEMFT